MGGGLNVVTEDPEGPQDPTTNDLMIDAVAGVGWDVAASPFLQLRVELTDPAKVGLAVGVRF